MLRSFFSCRFHFFFLFFLFFFFFFVFFFFFFQAEDGIRDHCVTGVQTCALPICRLRRRARGRQERCGRRRDPHRCLSGVQRRQDPRTGPQHESAERQLDITCQ